MELNLIISCMSATLALLGVLESRYKWVFISFLTCFLTLSVFPLLFMLREFFTSKRSKRKRILFAINKLYYGDTIETEQNLAKCSGQGIYCNPFTNDTTYCSHTRVMTTDKTATKLVIDRDAHRFLVFTQDGSMTSDELRANDLLRLSSVLGVRVEHRVVFHNGFVFQMVIEKGFVSYDLYDGRNTHTGSHISNALGYDYSMTINVLNYIIYLRDQGLYCCFLSDGIHYDRPCHCLNWRQFIDHCSRQEIYLSKNHRGVQLIFEGYIKDKLEEDIDELYDRKSTKAKSIFGQNNFKIFSDYFTATQQKILIDIFLKNINCKTVFLQVLKTENWQWKRCFCDMSYFLEKIGLCSLKGVDTSINPRSEAINKFRHLIKADIQISNQSKKFLADYLLADKDTKKSQINQSPYIVNKLMPTLWRMTEPIAKPFNRKNEQCLKQYEHITPIFLHTKYFTSGNNITYKDVLNRQPKVVTDQDKILMKANQTKYVKVFIDNNMELRNHQEKLDYKLALACVTKRDPPLAARKKKAKPSSFKGLNKKTSLEYLTKYHSKHIKTGVKLSNYYKNLENLEFEPDLVCKLERSSDKIKSRSKLKKLTVLKSLIMHTIDELAPTVKDNHIQDAKAVSSVNLADGSTSTLSKICPVRSNIAPRITELNAEVEVPYTKPAEPSVFFSYDKKGKKVYGLEGRTYTLTKVRSLIDERWGSAGIAFFEDSAKAAEFPYVVKIQKVKEKKVVLVPEDYDDFEDSDFNSD